MVLEHALQMLQISRVLFAFSAAVAVAAEQIGQTDAAELGKELALSAIDHDSDPDPILQLPPETDHVVATLRL